MLRMIRRTFLSAKIQFSVIQFVKVISNKPFLTRECAHAHERVIAIVTFSLGRSVGWLFGSVVNFRACAVNEF